MIKGRGSRRPGKGLLGCLRLTVKRLNLVFVGAVRTKRSASSVRLRASPLGLGPGRRAVCQWFQEFNGFEVGFFRLPRPPQLVAACPPFADRRGHARAAPPGRAPPGR